MAASVSACRLDQPPIPQRPQGLNFNLALGGGEDECGTFESGRRENRGEITLEGGGRRKTPFLLFCLGGKKRKHPIHPSHALFGIHPPSLFFNGYIAHSSLAQTQRLHSILSSPMAPRVIDGKRMDPLWSSSSFSVF